MKQGIIFDLDGTLIDTQKELAMISNGCLERQGITSQPVEAYRNYVGWGIRVMLQKAYAGSTGKVCDEKLLDLMYNDFFIVYKKNPVGSTEIYPGIIEMLETLKDRGLFMAVATNKSIEIAQKVVSSLFSDRFFQCVYGPSIQVAKKPDPFMIHTIINQSSLSNEEFIYCGDSLIDLKTAQNSSLPFAGVSWGYEESSILSDAGANWIIEHPMDLIHLIK